MWRLPTRSEDVFKQFVDLKSWPGYTQTLSGWCGNWAQRLPSGCEILAAPLCPPGPGRPRHGPLLQAHSPGYGVRPSHHYLRQAPAPLPPLLASPQLRTTGSQRRTSRAFPLGPDGPRRSHSSHEPRISSRRAKSWLDFMDVACDGAAFPRTSLSLTQFVGNPVFGREE